MKKILLICVCLFLGFSGFAESVSVEDANRMAVRFFSSDSRVKNNEVPLPLTPVSVDMQQYSQNEDAPAFYIFNRGNNQGFVIISGEDSTRPVLAYSYEGAFSAKNMPENLKGWMTCIAGEIAEVRKLNLEPDGENIQAWNNDNTGDKSVELWTPDWNQGAPYNNLCPEYSPGYHCYTGCAITATAIVMGYHQWPDSGTGTFKGYTSNAATVSGITLGHPYEWLKMPYLGANGPDESNPGEGDAVATLMRDLGVMARANYDYSETGASLFTISVKVPRHMKYRDCLFYTQQTMFTAEEWANLLKEELDASRPIIYEGYVPDGRTGHAFVLDGYDRDGMFSVNWGWGGISNGYYWLNALNPYEQGAGGAPGSGFSNQAGAILRMIPNRPGEEIEHFDRFQFITTPYVGVGLQLSDPNQKIEPGVPFEMTAGRIMHLGTDPYLDETKLVLTDRDGNIKKDLYTTPVRDLMPGNAIMPLDELRDHITITLDEPVAEGDRIRFVYKSGNGWKPVLCTNPEGNWEIVLNGSDTPTGAEENMADHIFVTGNDGIVSINGLVPGTPVRICNLYGQTVYRANSPATTARITLPKDNIYIVLVSGKSYKVKL